MEGHLTVIIMQYIVVVIAILVIFATIGLKRGWKAQLVNFALVLALWSLASVKGDMLIRLANMMYRGLTFFARCGAEEDPVACLEAAALMQTLLVNPENPNHARLFFLIVLAGSLLLSSLVVVRLGKAPLSAPQKLMGTVMGLANGFMLSYFLLLIAPYRQQIPLPIAEAVGGEYLLHRPEGNPGLNPIFQGGLPLTLLIVLVLFVVLAVRFIRPTKEEP